MKTRTIIPLVLGAAVLLGTAYAASPQSRSVAKDNPKDKVQASDSRGAELFAIHCGRCHKPPDNLSPRVVPAVMAHMRNRAMLSQKEEEEILKFLAP
jgi:mono/diheme cytochrome c family protein